LIIVKQTRAVIWLSRAVMRCGAMAQESNVSMTCSLFRRPLHVSPPSAASPRTIEGRLEPQAYCHRPGTDRRPAPPVHNEQSESSVLRVGYAGRDSAPQQSPMGFCFSAPPELVETPAPGIESGVRGQGVRPSAIRPWASTSLPLRNFLKRYRPQQAPVSEVFSLRDRPPARVLKPYAAAIPERNFGSASVPVSLNLIREVNDGSDTN
jgi:hypothetical protein